MAEILLKDIEIPKKGRTVLVIEDDGEVWFPNDYNITRSCPSEFFESKTTRAIEVPTPHGRLGDLDALKTYLDNTIKEATEIGLPMTSEYLMGLIDYAIKNAPTIIEASEERE